MQKKFEKKSYVAVSQTCVERDEVLLKPCLTFKRCELS